MNRLASTTIIRIDTRVTRLRKLFMPIPPHRIASHRKPCDGMVGNKTKAANRDRGSRGCGTTNVGDSPRNRLLSPPRSHPSTCVGRGIVSISLSRHATRIQSYNCMDKCAPFALHLPAGHHIARPKGRLQQIALLLGYFGLEAPMSSGLTGILLLRARGADEQRLADTPSWLGDGRRSATRNRSSGFFLLGTTAAEKTAKDPDGERHCRGYQCQDQRQDNPHADVPMLDKQENHAALES